MEHEAHKNVDPVSDVGMQQAYRLVVDQVQQLRKARQALDVKLAKAEQAREVLRQFLSDPDTKASSRLIGNEIGAGENKKKFRKGSQTAEVIARARALLKKTGRPLERRELLEGIAADGYQIKTKDPARFIGRTLWESDDFVHIPRQGYWLAEDDIPGPHSE